MDENQELARQVLSARFETQRSQLRGVAYRMLGSFSEADDAVQEAWLHVTRAGTAGVENLGGWLTTIVARICLDMLRTRKARREVEPAPEGQLPDPVVTRADADPEGGVLLADSVGLALLVVLETLDPAERLAFVLHDMFGLPFEEIAPLVERTPAAARQLASRARRRVQGVPAPAASPAADRARQRAVVDAFLAASRGGDFDALVAVLDPEVIQRVDLGAGKSRLVRGAADVAKQSLFYSNLLGSGRVNVPVLVNGAPGLLVLRDGQLFSVMAFTVTADKIAALDVYADAARLRGIDLAAFIA
jgi:RNA polymerase sigma-70 factor (ECF subfamily)